MEDQKQNTTNSPSSTADRLKEPPVCFGFIPKNEEVRFWSIRVDDKIACWVAITILGKHAQIHTRVEFYTVEVRRQLVYEWEHYFIPWLRGMGVKEAHAANSVEEEDLVKWSKFIRLFGFPTPKPIWISSMEI